MKNTPSPLFASVILSALLLGCAQQQSARTEFVLGTVCTVNLYEKGTDRVYDEIFARLRELESILSANRDDSNLATINANAGIAPVEARTETLTVLTEALDFSEKTEGALDPTVGPLVKAWNIGTDFAAVPAPDAIQDALALVDYRKVLVNEADKTVFLTDKGMRLDLGAVAKGYAADEIIRIIAERKIQRAIVDLGGNIYAYGEKAPGKNWTIGIRDPETTQGTSIMSIPIKNESVVTSGIYERYFEENGKRYHHILDTKTGYPAENELLSVSIVSTNSMLADALSTSTFLLGTEKGLELIEGLEKTDAIFINKDHEVRVSSGLKGRITILDKRYTLIER